MTAPHEAFLARLLAPINPARPAGDDLAYTTLLDPIREARRADDATLAQGDWATPVKSADWSRVARLCESALAERSKDLQLAVWLAEALTRTNAAAGLANGVRVVTGLLDGFWEGLHPALDGNDADERIARLEWLNRTLADALRAMPLTAPACGGHSWYRFRESRDVDNLALRAPEAREQALADGKIDGETFDRDAARSGQTWFRQLDADLANAQDAIAALVAALDRHFGPNAPGMGDLESALADCRQVARRHLAPTQATAVSTSASTASPHSEAARANLESPTPSPRAGVTPAQPALHARTEAILQLRAVADYFRTHEPHSPVALLVERAARWADMPLEAWLADVIKDDGTLGQLRELLDIRAG